MKKVTTYTDGACSGNPGPGGWGAIIRYMNNEKEISGGCESTTNNRMELTAVIEALKLLKEPCDITVYSDSQYFTNAINNGWAVSWRAKGWKRSGNEKVLNPELWEELLNLLEKNKYEVVWVKGHAGHPENERCDALAVGEIKKLAKNEKTASEQPKAEQKQTSKKILIVVDMQNDFITGSLGTPEAQGIVNAVKEKVESFDGDVIFTRDTHYTNYLLTSEGKNLPLVHCVKGTDGWQIEKSIDGFRIQNKCECYDKETFGSKELAENLLSRNNGGVIEEITLIGVCTDICVISNALLLKAFLPETKISVDSTCCAGTTVLNHENALSSMKMCQIDVL